MATINIRVDDQLKKQAEEVLDEIGLGMTSALTIFSLEIPNKKTLEAFEEVEDISSGKKNAKKYKSVQELRKDLKV